MSAIGDIIVGALQDLLRVLFSPITELIEESGSVILKTIVDTPHPNAVFAPPTNDPWAALYAYYWDVWMPMMLFLWAAMIGLVIFFESTSHLFGSYHRSKLKRRAFSGLLGLLAWWWIAALSLRFMDALTGVIIPSLDDVTLFETLSFSAMGVLGTVVTLSVDLVLFLLIGIIYVIRQVVLYLFVLLMPLLIVFWIPGVGPFALASQFMKRLAGFFVPFLFMTVPVALMFRLGGILGTNFGISLGGFGAWLLALVIPIVAVISPFVLFWQAGALFFMADRAFSHVSRRRAASNVETIRTRGQETTHAGQNFSRGLRGEAAQKPSGQVLMDSSASRAHAAGSRMRSTGSTIRGLFDSGGDGGGGASGGTAGASEQGVGTSSGSDRANDFGNLRGRSDSASSRSPSRSPSDESESSDDRPRYIN